MGDYVKEYGRGNVIERWGGKGRRLHEDSVGGVA